MEDHVYLDEILKLVQSKPDESFTVFRIFNAIPSIKAHGHGPYLTTLIEKLVKDEVVEPNLESGNPPDIKSCAKTKMFLDKGGYTAIFKKLRTDDKKGSDDLQTNKDLYLKAIELFLSSKTYLKWNLVLSIINIILLISIVLILLLVKHS
jgi:hypothetical protein